MPALMYAELATALLIDALAGRRFMPRAFALITTGVVVVFAFYSPWVYLFPLTNEGHARRRWLKRWD